ncbi:TetR family transcriptional regulator [Nocardia uniformis]|uniref:TetR family transcriptional regulator n=1 Tax=Nocardia uniformis TaxID=53432 RepID=A0A849C8Q0_9NOCA|nr:TetR family transcriptional regulator [Nocardia uniformis]NNH71239.1 TetR family transcriptional regulator [Nocardia uniformis]
MGEASTDGRKLKGQRSKAELIEATIRIVARDGVAGVSHRAVAKEAGLPPTSAAYHFKTIDDLLTAALTSCMDQDAERIRQLTDTSGGGEEGVRALAAVMVTALTETAHLQAEFELYLLAACRPELRDPPRRWLAAIERFGRRYTDDPVRLRILAGTIDGMLMQALVTGAPPTRTEWEAVLRTILR